MYPRLLPPLLTPSRAAQAQPQPAVDSSTPAQDQRTDPSRVVGDPHASKVIIRLSKLTQLLSVSRSTVYLRLNSTSKYYDPRFPKSIRLGANAVGWLLADVHAYIDYLRNCDAASV